jgi:D-sedoheptulose 7-phosphate isomerase
MNKILSFSSMPHPVPGLPSDADALVVGFLRDSIKTKEAVIAQCVDDITAAAKLVADAMFAGHKLLLCGNGGSAGDSQHIAAEFVSVLNQNFPRPALPALALTTDSSMLTASANDFGFDGVFERQVEALGQPGDVLLGITTSGNSKNVVRAVELATGKGLKTVALTGGCGGRIDTLVDAAIRVPSTNTQCIQESHIAIGHIICDLVERTLFQKEAR